jgi:hypothetical protein
MPFLDEKSTFACRFPQSIIVWIRMKSQANFVLGPFAFANKNSLPTRSIKAYYAV